MLIRTLTAMDIAASLPELVELLDDSVASGASVGYHPPLDRELAAAFWRGIAAEVAAGTRIMLAGYDGGELAGTVQLGLATRPNSMHRAEVQKLLVHTRRRGQGIARRLMEALEAEALANGRTLLVLDTKKGDVAEGLYGRLGYVRVGEIPRYVTDGAGGFDTTVVFYKHLPGGGE